MSQIKLYKKFYCISNISASQTYALIDPYILSANTYTAGSGATESPTLIESSLTISQESTGVYFADLNSYLYASDVTYDLVWFVNYINTAPTKKISTRFRININTITNQIEVEYINYPIEIEILNSSIEIDIS